MAFRLARQADIAAMQNQPMMGVHAERFGHFFVELFLNRQNILAGRQTAAIGQAEDMGIDGKSGNAESLIHHHIGGFASDAGQRQ